MKLAILLAVAFPLNSFAATPYLTGQWQLASPRGCATDAPYEDVFFHQLVKEFTWTFTDAAHLRERIVAVNPETNKSCEAAIEYDAEVLPRQPDGTPLGYMERLRLTRTRFDSKCLRENVRARAFELRINAFPEFLETYEWMAAPTGPCPQGDSIITQFRKK